MRANKVVCLVIAGVSSTWADQSAARDAHDRDYDVVVLEDACAAADESEHDYSMRLLRKIANVIKVSELQSLELCAGE